MKIFKKIKFYDGKTEIFLFNIKVFSYRKKVNNGFDNAEYVRRLGVKVGENTYICSGCIWGSEPYLIEIGKNCLLSINITFLTHDASVHVCKQYFSQSYTSANAENNAIFGKIKIGDNCFIGCSSIILPNITIGNNCVIGAGSVVTKNIPDGEVWGGSQLII